MPRKTSSDPTMDDVAAQAKVSQMTVSRVLNKKGYVSPEVRERVLVAARALGYVQNRIASSLRNEASALIAAVLPTLNNRVFTEVLSGVNDAAERHDCQTAFAVTEYDQAREEALVQGFLAWRPRGLILAGLEHSDTLRRAVAASGAAVVEVMDIDGTPIDTAVGLAQQEAGHTMARHFIERGYRRIAWVGSQAGLDLRAQKRFNGFAQTVRQAGATLLSKDETDQQSSMSEGRRLTQLILSRSDRPDAISYANDDLAAGGLMHCLKENLNVPGDVALSGFNGLAFLEALPMRLTTIETPRFEIGLRAIDLIVAQRFVTMPQRVVDLGFRLVVGDTT